MSNEDPRKQEIVAALSTMVAEQAIKRLLVHILAGHTRWGWAVIRNREFYSRLSPGKQLAESDAGGMRARPYLVIDSAVGSPLVVPITEEDLADLGPCPNL